MEDGQEDSRGDGLGVRRDGRGGAPGAAELRETGGVGPAGGHRPSQPPPRPAPSRSHPRRPARGRRDASPAATGARRRGPRWSGAGRTPRTRRGPSEAATLGLRGEGRGAGPLTWAGPGIRASRPALGPTFFLGVRGGPGPSGDRRHGLSPPPLPPPPAPPFARRGLPASLPTPKSGVRPVGYQARPCDPSSPGLRPHSPVLWVPSPPESLERQLHAGPRELCPPRSSETSARQARILPFLSPPRSRSPPLSPQPSSWHSISSPPPGIPTAGVRHNRGG